MLTVRLNRNIIKVKGVKNLANHKLLTLRAARVNCGYTQGEVAELAGRNVDTITYYEKDSTNIPKSLETFLLDLYDVPGDYIFFGKESDLIGHRKRKKEGGDSEKQG